MKETTLYGKNANIRYYKLTKESFELGSQIYGSYLREVANELEGILANYPARLIRIAALSAIEPKKGTLLWLSVRLQGLELSTAIFTEYLNLKMSVISPEELAEAYGTSMRMYRDLRLVFERLRETYTKIYNPRLYDIFMSKVLVKFDGNVHKKMLQLMEELSQLGLAGKIPIYDSNGKHVGEEYRAPPEMAYLLGEYSSEVDFFDEIRHRFLAVQLLQLALKGKLTKGEVLTAIDKLGMSEEEVKVGLNIMYERGITTKYNEKGELESPAFIVLDEEKAMEEIKRILTTVEDMILKA